MENSERIQSHTVRIENSVKKLMVDNSDTNSALNKQNVAVSDLEKLFNGMAIDNAKCVDVTDTSATAEDVMSGKIFYDKDGNRTEGTYIIETLENIATDIDTVLSGNATQYLSDTVLDQIMSGNYIIKGE